MTHHLKTITSILQWPLVVFVLHLIALYSGLYYVIPRLDNALHFLGGMSIATGTLSFFTLAQQLHWMDIRRWWLRLLLCLGTVALAAISWECMEYVLDHTVGSHMQGGITDTMSDLLLALTGALLLSIFREHSAKNRLAKIAHIS